MARIVEQIRSRWPKVRILLRADSGFARETLMARCEANRVNFVFGLARNARLVGEIEAELAAEDAGPPPTAPTAGRCSPLSCLRVVAGALRGPPPAR